VDVVTLPSGAAKRVVLPAWMGAYLPEEWSPDRTLVVGVWLSPTDSEGGIAVLAPGSGKFSVIIRTGSGEGMDWYPQWSPSGRWIAVERWTAVEQHSGAPSSRLLLHGLWVVSPSGSPCVEVAPGRPETALLWRHGGFAWDDTQDTLYWVDDCEGKQKPPVLHAAEVSKSGALRARTVALAALGKAQELAQARLVPRPARGKVLVDTDKLAAESGCVWLADLTRGGTAVITLKDGGGTVYAPFRLLRGEQLLAREWQGVTPRGRDAGVRLSVVQYDLRTRRVTQLLPPQSQYLDLLDPYVPPSGGWLYWRDDQTHAVYRTPLTKWRRQVVWVGQS
jgi:hypothetical protein